MLTSARRIFVQTHPDVMIIPPDPPQMLQKADQVGTSSAPTTARRTDASGYIAGRRLHERGGELAVEDSGRAARLRDNFSPDRQPFGVAADDSFAQHAIAAGGVVSKEVEDYLAEVRTEWKERERGLVARLCGGGLGRARSFDLARYLTARQDALALLAPAMGARDHSELFKVTEGYRAGGDGKAKLDSTIRVLYSLLEDLLFVKSGTPEMVRNTDLQAELKRMSEQVDFDWIVTATQRLGELESGMRRNLMRSLALDSFAASLEKA